MKKNQHPPRITRIELSQSKIVLRVVLFVLALCIGISALAYGISSLFGTESGWNTVEVATAERTHGNEFTLQYYFGASGASAVTEKKQLTTLYTELMETTYLVFNKDEASDTVRNLHYLNGHVNEDVVVDEILYDALEKIQEYGSRYLYLAPIYVEYNRMFFREDADEAAMYDPEQNAESAQYVKDIAAFAADPNHIDVKLLGNGKVRLSVSDAYMAFAEKYEIEEFLDFAWMRNAFIADAVADMMSEKGFRFGYIASYDGFTRNLDESGTSYSFNLFHRVGNEILMGGTMEYSQPTSIVFLRDYPMTDMDRWHYCTFSDGRITTTYLDPADGMSKSALHNLVSYSHKAGCADVLLQAAPVFIADEFDPDLLDKMADQDIFSIWGTGKTLQHNGVEGSVTFAEN